MLNSRGSVQLLHPRHAAGGERLDPASAFGVRANLGNVLQVQGDVQGAIDHLGAALTEVRRRGDPALERGVRLNLISALVDAGELEAAGRECEPLGDPPSGPRRAIALGMVAAVQRELGRLPAAASRYELATALAVQDGDTRSEIPLMVSLASCYLEMGRDDEAMADAEQALGRARHVDERNV